MECANQLMDRTSRKKDGVSEQVGLYGRKRQCGCGNEKRTGRVGIRMRRVGVDDPCEVGAWHTGIGEADEGSFFFAVMQTVILIFGGSARLACNAGISNIVEELCEKKRHVQR